MVSFSASSFDTLYGRILSLCRLRSQHRKASRAGISPNPRGLPEEQSSPICLVVEKGADSGLLG